MAGPYGLPTVWTESVSAVTATNSVEVGTLRYEGEILYQYVYNAGTTQINPGEICTLSAVTGYSVTVSSIIDPISKPFGVVQNATLTTATYGWVGRSGIMMLENAGNTAIAAGYPIATAADGSVDAPTGGTGTTWSKAVFAKALTATTTAGNFHALVQCM